MKKTYIKPAVEVMSFAAEDILTASGYSASEVDVINNSLTFKSNTSGVQVVDGVNN